MAKRDLPSPEVLRQLLDYDPETGTFWWKARPASMFKCARDHAVWSSRYAGKRAGSVDGGYIRIAVFNRQIKAHRIAWAVTFGEWPNQQIDHIDGDGTNNGIANLRHVSGAENSRNQKRRSDGKSGVTGVYWVPRDQIWQAQIGFNGKLRHVGRFKDFDSAVAARKAAEKRLGFHPNHANR